jgi:hypothetical protein
VQCAVRGHLARNAVRAIIIHNYQLAAHLDGLDGDQDPRLDPTSRDGLDGDQDPRLDPTSRDDAFSEAGYGRARGVDAVREVGAGGDEREGWTGRGVDGAEVWTNALLQTEKEEREGVQGEGDLSFELVLGLDYGQIIGKEERYSAAISLDVALAIQAPSHKVAPPSPPFVCMCVCVCVSVCL